MKKEKGGIPPKSNKQTKNIKLKDSKSPKLEKLEEEEDISESIKERRNQPIWVRDAGNQEIKNDPEFTFCIGIFVETSPEYYGLMEMFNETATNGNRWKIKVISKEYIRKVVHNNLRSPKFTPLKQLCKQIVRHSGHDLEEKIPTSLLAYFIIYELRRLKCMYIQMRSYEADIEQARLSRLEKALEYDLSKLTQVETPQPKSSSPQLAKRKKTKGVYGSRRPESELCTRLEERDLRFIEDFPVDGPQVYIAITTIYDPLLPIELIEVLQVPVNCVVKVGITEETVTCKDKDWGKQEKIKNFLNDLTNEYYKKRSNKKKPFNKEYMNSKKEMEIKNFWSGYISKIQQPEKTSFYASTIISTYIPSLSKINFNECKWKNKLTELLYNEISYALYNLSDLNTLYQKYMSSMDITNLDSLGKYELSNMKLYNEILRYIPNESINVPLIFDCIIAEISHLLGEYTEYDLISEKNYGQHKSQRHNNLQTSLKELNLKHDVLTIKSHSTDLKPRTILYGDLSRLKSYHIGKPAELVTEKTFHFLSMRYKKLFQNIKRSDEDKLMYRKHIHIFRKAIGIRDKKKLSELLILLEIIARDPFGPKYFPTTHETIKEQTFEKKKNTCSEYVIEDILNNISTNKHKKENLMQNMNSMEEMNSEVLVQTLFNMSITHNTSEMIYIPLLDGFLYKFYNCPKNQYATCVMQTPITLRDFIKYSLPEEKDWTEKTLAELQKSSAPETFQSELDLLAEEIVDPIDPPVRISPNLTVDSSSFGVQTKTFNNSEDERVQELNKIGANKKHFLLQEESDKLDISKKVKHKQVVSKIYDIGPGRRVQFYSRIIEAMFRHGTKIRIHFQHQLYEKKLINLELQTCGHRIYYSYNLDVNEDPSKLMIQHRTGMTLSFQQRECKKSLTSFVSTDKNENASNSEADTESDTENEKEDSSPESKDFNESCSYLTDEAEKLERCQIKSSPCSMMNITSKFSFSASWPSGYYMECNTLPNENMFYIKQSYLTKGPSCKLIENEIYRLNLQNNNVIKFTNNNTFEIMYPTGKKIVCFNYVWKKIKKTKIDKIECCIYEKHIKQIKPIHYKILHTDGKVITIKEGQKIAEENIHIRHHTDILNDYKVSEMANGTNIIYKNDSSQVVEFSDGTRFTTLVHISPEEVFCDWNLEEKMKWFQGFTDFFFISDILGMEQSTEEKIDLSPHKGKLENEGYLNIKMTTFIEHPNFATTYNCNETKTTVIRFPMSTTIYLYYNGTYDVIFGNGTNISIMEDRFVIDKYLNNSLFQHSVIMPHALKFDEIPDPPLVQFLTSDIYGNELKIDTTNYIHYRYAVSKENRFCLKHLTDNVNYLFLRRDLSGLEIFPRNRLMNAKNIIKETEGSNIQEFWNTPFKDTILLYPVINASEEWIMPYSIPIKIVEKKKPSTYGKSWSFPFQKKQQFYFHIPKTLTMRVLKTFVCENVHERMAKIMKDYKNMILDQQYNSTCKCQKSKPWEVITNKNKQNIANILYKHGNITINTPDESFMNYVREYIVLHAARRAMQEKKKSKIIHRYNKQKSYILQRQIPPYFGSCFGIAYLLTKEIKEKATKIITEKEYSIVLDGLLDKSITSITENDVCDITQLLQILNPELFRERVTLEKVLKTGKELEDSFNNMREVLKYHKGVNTKEVTKKLN